MLTVPPQHPPVYRDCRGQPPDGDGPAGLSADGGVEASRSRCDGLSGPAQSMCYAAQYGVSV